MSNFESYKLNDRGKLMKTFNCDIFWVSAINETNFLNVLMETVISDAGKRGNHVRFGGTIRPKTTPAKPKKDYVNIYFVEDAFLRWTCCLVEMRPSKTTEPVMIWYDPSDQLGRCTPRFDRNRKDQVIRQFEPMQVIDLKTPERVQQFCTNHPAQDIFSLSWSVMFSSVYINDAFNDFAKIDFVRWQTQPLKMWIRCIIARLPPNWIDILDEPKFKRFFSHCRRVVGNGYDAVVERLPKIHKFEGKKPCIYSVITYYLQLPKPYRT